VADFLPLIDWLADVTEVKHSACELLRLKKSGGSPEATGTDDSKPLEEAKRRGPATWPGD